MAPASFAVTYTVRNEARLLGRALDYHLRAGAARVYLYWDGTTDEGPAIAAGRERVAAMPSVRPDALGERAAWLRQLEDRWSWNFDIRKRFNTVEATRRAAAEGIEWLICIDPDELVLPDPAAAMTESAIPDLLGALPARVDQVVLPNLELLPVGETVADPFVECRYFVERFPALEASWRLARAALRRVVRDPEWRARAEHRFFRAFLGPDLPRLMRHPLTGAALPTGPYLGYMGQKAFIRAGRAWEFAFNVHKWQRDRRSPVTVTRGRILHYDLFDASSLAAKFRQRTAFRTSPEFFVRHAIEEIAQSADEAALGRFFRDSIAVNDAARLERLLRRGVVRRIDAAAAFLAGT